MECEIKNTCIISKKADKKRQIPYLLERAPMLERAPPLNYIVGKGVHTPPLPLF